MSGWYWGTWDETLALTWSEVRSVLIAVVIIGGIAAVRYLLPGDWFHDGQNASDGAKKRPVAPQHEESGLNARQRQHHESDSTHDKMAE